MSGIALLLLSNDAGLIRLSTALRATVTWAVVVTVLLTTVTALGGSASYVIPGMLVVSAATMSLSMNLTGRQRRLALLAGAVSASGALVLGTLVAGRPFLESIVFLALGVATLGAFTLGPAAIVVALAAVVAYYAASLIAATWQTLPGNVASVTLGAVLSAVLLGIVLVDRPARTARRLLASVNAASDRVAAATPKNRSHRIDDVLTTVIAARAHAALYPEVWPETLNANDSARLRSIAHDAESGITPPPVSVTSWPSAATIATRPTPVAHDPGGRGIVSMGVQLLAATTLALIAAQLIYPRYWFWGVLAALVMLFGTSSAADAIGKGVRRVLGTAVALPLGVVLAQLLQQNLPALVILVVVVMFLQQYLGDAHYGWSVFFLTVLLSLLFSLTGADVTAALDARLLLTAVGACIGVLVALFVLPTRTGVLLRGRAIGAIDAALDLVTAMAGQASPDEVQVHERTLERRLRLLRDEAAAAERGWPLSARHDRTRYLVLAGEDAARELRGLVHQYRVDVALSDPARDEARRLLDLLRTVRAQLTTDEDRAFPPGNDTTSVAQTDELTTRFSQARGALRSLAAQLTS